MFPNCRTWFGPPLWLVLLSACGINPQLRQQVDTLVAQERQAALSCPSDQVNRCALRSSLVALSEQDMTLGRHHIGLLETGADALALRLHLIRAARQTIEAQYFIFSGDDSGRLVMQELVTAARRGVKVRLLFDQLFSVSDLNALTSLVVAHRNLEVRVYNPTFNEARTSTGEFVSGIACCFRRFNQRMHNKLLLVDGQLGITGGRNISDRYFDYDSLYVFKDRDVLVSGPVVSQMEESFEWFWQSEVTLPLEHLSDVADRLLQRDGFADAAYAVPERFRAVAARADDPAFITQSIIGSLWPVANIAYFSDPPRKPFLRPSTNHADITEQLHRMISGAKRSIVIQSPYLVLSRTARKLFKSLRRENPELEVVFSSNSLASTDAYAAYAFAHKRKKYYIKRLGFHLYEFKPYPGDRHLFVPRYEQLSAEKAAGLYRSALVTGAPGEERDGPRVGLHAKSIVVDQRVAMIGSHNFDPRSEGLNTENGLIITDAPFARHLEELIRRDIEPRNSWVVAAKPGKVPVVSDIGNAIETVSRSLPVFDVWPLRYTSAFELREGYRPVAPDHPDFYRNYVPIGSFPEVTTTRRQVMTRIIGSFFGFLAPIM